MAGADHLHWVTQNVADTEPPCVAVLCAECVFLCVRRVSSGAAFCVLQHDAEFWGHSQEFDQLVSHHSGSYRPRCLGVPRRVVCPPQGTWCHCFRGERFRFLDTHVFCDL